MDKEISLEFLEEDVFGVDSRQRGLRSAIVLFIINAIVNFMGEETYASFPWVVLLIIFVIAVFLAVYSIYNCVSFLRNAKKSRGWPIVAIIYSIIVLISYLISFIVGIVVSAMK